MASVQKRANGRWRARYKDAEDREHARHFTRKADAELWLAHVRADQLRGTYVDPRAGKITLRSSPTNGSPPKGTALAPAASTSARCGCTSSRPLVTGHW